MYYSTFSPPLFHWAPTVVEWDGNGAGRWEKWVVDGGVKTKAPSGAACPLAGPQETRCKSCSKGFQDGHCII